MSLSTRCGPRPSICGPRKLIWEEVSHSYTEAAAEGDMVVGKRKSPKGEYVKRTPSPERATVVVTREEPRSRNKLLPADLS